MKYSSVELDKVHQYSITGVAHFCNFGFVMEFVHNISKRCSKDSTSSAYSFWIHHCPFRSV